MTRKYLFLLSCVAIGGAAIGITATPLMAQSQQVTGFNLMRADIAGDNGTEIFTKMANGEWVQYGGRGEVRFRFVEIGRDATSVYLHDLSRDFKIQLDVSDRTMSFRKEDGQKAVFATMIAMASTPAQSGTASRSVPSAQPVAASQPTPPANADDFNPFADPADPQPTATTPMTNRQIITNAASRPAFLDNRQGAGSTTAASTSAPFDGPWVAEGKIATELGDGIKSAVEWHFREALWINTAADGSITINFDVNPGNPVTLAKTGEGEYSGDGYSASFAVIDKKNIRLTLTGAGRSREYNISTVPSGAKLSRSRIKPEIDDEIDTFTAGNLVPRYNDMFLSYRSEKMDLFNAGRGAGPRIFKTPGAQDFSIESNLQSKTIPYGLRGQEIRRTEGNQLESLITNMSSFEKSMSLNFGVSGSFRGASGGWEVTRDESKGAERNDGTAKAYGIARSEVYALFLDKPNMLLDPGFKYDILQLADNRMSAQQFVAKYGTHYANAIHYGGIGKNQRTVTTTEYKKWARESTSFQQQGGFDAGPAGSLKAKGGLTMASGNANGGTSMFTTESWSAVGGSGSMTSNGWTVDERNSVPVRYDLRPLSELISPIFFGVEWNSPKRVGLQNARYQLDNEITRYLQSQPKAEDKMIGPIVYQLTFNSLKCVSNGDDGTGPAILYGKISASVHGLEGYQDLILYNTSYDNVDSAESISCNGGKEYPINQTVLVAGNRNPNGAGQGSFSIISEDVHEYDPSAVDYDEAIAVQPADKWIYMKDWNAEQSRTDLEGTALTNVPDGKNGPDIRVRVTFKAIQ